jgi:hypothetical protein
MCLTINVSFNRSKKLWYKLMISPLSDESLFGDTLKNYCEITKQIIK